MVKETVAMPCDQPPETFTRIVGALPPAGSLPELPYPFETVRPEAQGYVERDGVKSWYATFGQSGPWIAFAPVYQIVHMQALKATARGQHGALRRCSTTAGG